MSLAPNTVGETGRPCGSGLPVEPGRVAALTQLRNIASLPMVAHVAVMPTCISGRGHRGLVIGMRGRSPPGAVGVDNRCGMGAVRTSLPRRICPKPRGLRYRPRGRHPVASTLTTRW
jgi:RNA-splicing ligase RtcB